VTAPLTAADTRIDPRLTRRFGVAELHAIHFAPRADRGGPCDAVGLSIPEASRQVIRYALARARRRKARVAFHSDTLEQAQRMLEVGERLLPDHRFVALARAEAGAWGPLT
jgi:hypothetical protein